MRGHKNIGELLEVLSNWMRDMIRDGKNNAESTLKVFLFFIEREGERITSCDNNKTSTYANHQRDITSLLVDRKRKVMD